MILILLLFLDALYTLKLIAIHRRPSMFSRDSQEIMMQYRISCSFSSTCSRVSFNNIVTFVATAPLIVVSLSYLLSSLSSFTLSLASFSMRSNSSSLLAFVTKSLSLIFTYSNVNACLSNVVMATGSQQTNWLLQQT